MTFTLTYKTVLNTTLCYSAGSFCVTFLILLMLQTTQISFNVAFSKRNVAIIHYIHTTMPWILKSLCRRPAYGSSGKHICCVKKNEVLRHLYVVRHRCLQLDLRPRLTDSFSCCSCLECWAFAWSPVRPDRGGDATSPCTPELPPPYLAQLARRCRGAPGGPHRCPKPSCNVLLEPHRTKHVRELVSS